VVASEGLARELLQQEQEEGADFADLARRHSLAPSRDQGGDLGVVCRAALPTAVAGVAFAAKEGEVAGPLLAEGGYHLYRIEQHLPAELDGPTAALVRQEVFAAWLRQRLAGVPWKLDWLEGPDGGG
jgi:parvulin-like peptidyl-prolyl isomerase